VTGLEKIFHHGLAHDAKTDEPNFGGHESAP
jgi:hypothetical protein